MYGTHKDLVLLYNYCCTVVNEHKTIYVICTQILMLQNDNALGQPNVVASLRRVGELRAKYQTGIDTEDICSSKDTCLLLVQKRNTHQ